MIYYGRTLRGLEEIAAQELIERLGAEILSTGHREIYFSAQEVSDLQSMGVLDDVFFFCGEMVDIDHTRNSLRRLEEEAMKRISDVQEALEQQERMGARRGLAGTFEVVASFLGRRNYNRFEIEAAVAKGLECRQGWVRIERDKDEGKADVVLRVHLWDNAGLLALRVFPRPLRQRAYKRVHLPGATPPQLARAMAILADIGPTARVLDPYCGTGTIPIESSAVEPRALLIGGDIALPALQGAKVNAAAAGTDLCCLKMSALALSFADGAVDRIVTNTPWGRQVDHCGEERRAWLEMRRVLSPRGKVIALVAEALEDYEGLRVVQQHRLRLFGKNSLILEMTPF